MRKKRALGAPKTSVSLAWETARLADRRAALLQIDRATYLRILLRNADIVAQAMDADIGVRPTSRFTRVKVSMDLPPRERARIAARVAPGSLSSYLEQLVLADATTPEAPLTILPRR